MKKMGLIVIMVGLLMGSSIALAANWEYLCNVSSGETCYYDTTSVTSVGAGIVSAQLRRDWSQESIARFEDKFKDISYTISVLEIDCRNIFYRQTRTTSYKKNGEIISGDEKISDWMSIPDGSIASFLKNEVCR